MIKGPKNAYPTVRGWVSPKGELLKSQKITQAQIDEWYGTPKPVVEEVVEELVIEEVIEAIEEPVEEEQEIDYDSMSRTELLNLAEDLDITIPGFRPTKKTIIEALKS